MPKSKSRKDLVDKRLNQGGNISCSSMIVTVFGDVISQHGGWVWLGSLIKVLEDLGFKERLVRTAVYRLVQSDWLQASRVGRCSYYCFTDMAVKHYEKAARRIYAVEQTEWDGSWTLVAPVFLDEEKKELFRKSLLWQGFNTLVSGMFAHPSSDRTSLDETIYEQGLNGGVIVLSAKTEDPHSQEAIKELVQNRWSIGELENFYKDFLDFYRPLAHQVTKEVPSQADSFFQRILLIHDYRRILLRDPDLPAEMLPHGWVGYEVQDLVKRLYKVLVGPSAEYIRTTFENAQGSVPAPSSKFFTRFGGLE